MYYNVFGEKVSKRRFEEMCRAAENRRELIAAGLTSRRDLFKMGLLTAGGMLVAKSGLSARAQNFPTNQAASSGSNTSPGTNQNCVPGNQTASPPTRAFITPLPVMRTATTVPLSSLSPQPTDCPNTSSGADGTEVRAACHQAPQNFPNQFPHANGLSRYYKFRQVQFATSQSPDLPSQTIWGFDDGSGAGPISPGPTYKANYGSPQLTRNINALPSVKQKNNTGFGLASVTTHLHNGHTPSESDGNPCDFYTAGNFCDQYYPEVRAGFSTTPFAPTGDVNESMSTLWYHDHRVDFTSQNTYKGLLGFHCLFSEVGSGSGDTGDETTGFHLPSFPQFDIPLAFADKIYDPKSGALVFDLFNLDGILGDKFLVNGVIQPFLEVSPRRYRFRLLDTGPSRFFEFFLTGNVGGTGSPTTNPFFLIGTDGNLIPNPIQVNSVRIGVAERVDVIIDFTNFAGQTLYLENRLNQINGQGPAAVDSQLAPENSSTTECSSPTVSVNTNQPAIKPAGAGNLVLQFRVTGPRVADNSVNPATNPTFFALPNTTEPARVVRTFKFDRLNGQWSINGQFMDCGTFRFAVKQNSVEHWLLTNLTGDWTHPVHIHLEEHQIMNRNRSAPTVATDLGRKDVTQLHPNERVELFFRFRDWLGKYPIHCHNVVHEDHAMMGLWHVVPAGQEDSVLVP
ncbi:MAG TPA: multicopper oxidase domain-containing protein [Candidatus Angelobacter sp.]|nr:multicopper oxidase domain-containing protein [Candidatus Angelobacter sp.]